MGRVRLKLVTCAQQQLAAYVTVEPILVIGIYAERRLRAKAAEIMIIGACRAGAANVARATYSAVVIIEVDRAIDTRTGCQQPAERSLDEITLILDIVEREEG